MGKKKRISFLGMNPEVKNILSMAKKEKSQAQKKLIKFSSGKKIYSEKKDYNLLCVAILSHVQEDRARRKFFLEGKRKLRKAAKIQSSSCRAFESHRV